MWNSWRLNKVYILNTKAGQRTTCVFCDTTNTETTPLPQKTLNFRGENKKKHVVIFYKYHHQNKKIKNIIHWKKSVHDLQVIIAGTLKPIEFSTYRCDVKSVALWFKYRAWGRPVLPCSAGFMFGLCNTRGLIVKTTETQAQLKSFYPILGPCPTLGTFASGNFFKIGLLFTYRRITKQPRNEYHMAFGECLTFGQLSHFGNTK